MNIKLLGFGLISFASYLMYVNRNLNDDSLLLGSGLALAGLLILVVGRIAEADSRRK